VSAKAAAVLAGALLLAFASISHAALEVKGTGGSSSARVMAQWNFLFTKETKINVEFVAANSDVGIREAIARNVDFGATEIPLSAEELTKNDLVQFPLLIGGVVVIVNIPGVEPGGLRLNSNLVSKIYLGELKFWNDDEIRAANPGLNLPRLPIKLVVRETAASTTLALTTFLAKTDRTWASRVGATSSRRGQRRRFQSQPCRRWDRKYNRRPARLATSTTTRRIATSSPMCSSVIAQGSI